jgi:hypothetical protein
MRRWMDYIVLFLFFVKLYIIKIWIHEFLLQRIIFLKRIGSKPKYKYNILAKQFLYC